MAPRAKLLWSEQRVELQGQKRDAGMGEAVGEASSAPRRPVRISVADEEGLEGVSVRVSLKTFSFLLCAIALKGDEAQRPSRVFQGN
jgi:hypothetical protein